MCGWLFVGFINQPTLRDYSEYKYPRLNWIATGSQELGHVATLAYELLLIQP